MDTEYIHQMEGVDSTELQNLAVYYNKKLSAERSEIKLYTPNSVV